MEKEGCLVNPEMLLISDRHVAILRLIGQGRSRKEVVGELSLSNKGEFIRELKNASDILGVSGETAAVNRAITLGILNLEELVDKDFDWRVFKYLNSTEKSILGAFIKAKGKSLTDEEFSGLNIKTSQDPKRYVQRSIGKIGEKLGFQGKTAAVVYYRAFLEKEEKTDQKSRVDKSVLSDNEINFLKLARQGLSVTVIGQRLFQKKVSGQTCKGRILKKLDVGSLEEAIVVAEEMGILAK